MELLHVSGISKTGRDGFALQDTSFSQAKGERIAVAGETGSGKTTLLKIIAGLVQPDKGQVLLNGQKVIGPNDQLIPGHRQIAYLSQHFELRNNYRVEEILSYANKLTDAAAEKLYAVCRIDHLLKRKTDQLSGGEKQRIAMARLLIGSPKLLVLDEPFSNLDLIHKQLLKAVLLAIGKELDISCLLSSHDPLDTLSWADKILVLQNGQVLQQGSAEEVYRKPVNEYVGGLFGNYSVIGQQLANEYPNFFPVHPFGKAMFLRPEQFRVCTISGTGIKGRVEAINFLGSAYEFVLRAGGQSITVRTMTRQFVLSAEIEVMPEPGKAWYV